MYIKILFISLIINISLYALTIENIIKDTLETNPIIKERIQSYKSAIKDVYIAKSGYYPKLDIFGAYGKERTNSISTLYKNIDLTKKEFAIVLSQNIFEGFGTQNDIKRQINRANSYAYSIIEEANKLSLDMAEAYINLFKQETLMKLAEENLKTHQKINKKIQERMDSGVGTTSELQQSISRLALANSNLLSETNNFEDIKTKFIKIYGKDIEFKKLSKPKNINYKFPKTFQEALQKALLQDPSLKVQRENIEVTKYNYEFSKKSFYPKIDLEIRSEWNNNIGGTEGHSDSTFVMLKFKYNLFNGKADTFNKEKMLTQKSKEMESLKDLKRRVKESIRLSWMAYKTLKKQIPFLEKYKEMSQKTLSSYLEEFDLGRRTLLDILDTEEELYSANRQLVTAKYDLIFAQYRILESMGIISYYIDKSIKKILQGNLLK